MSSGTDNLSDTATDDELSINASGPVRIEYTSPYPGSSHNANDDDEEDLIMQSIKHSPYDDDLWLNEAEANALGKYDDFHTIDWSRDRMRDRIRFRKVKKMKYQGTLMERIKVYFFCLLYTSPSPRDS